jgi:MFS family permease
MTTSTVSPGTPDGARTAPRRALGTSFRLLWLSVAISGTGDGMFLTAFPLLAAVLTRDPVLIAGVTVASRLPWLLFSLVAGAIADRFDRRRLMVMADIGRTIVVAVLGVSVLVHDAQVWLLYACAFGLGIGETIHANAAQAFLPQVVAPEALVPANARLTGMQVVTENFAGPPLGAVLFTMSGSVPFLADAASFAASAGLIRAVPDRPAPPERTSTRMWTDIREGVRFTLHHVLLRRLVTLLGLLNFFYFATEAVLILYTFDRLHAGRAVYTALFVAAAAGTIGTQWLVEPLERRAGAAATITIAFWLWAVALVGLAFTESSAIAIGLFFLLGAGDGLWRVLTVTLRQQLTPNRLLGRVNSAYRMVAQGVIPLGAAFGGAMAKLFGVRAPFVIAAVVFVVVAVSAPVLLRPARSVELG